MPNADALAYKQLTVAFKTAIKKILENIAKLIVYHI